MCLADEDVPQRVEVVAKLRRLARKRHSAAVGHFSSTVLTATKVGASVDEDSPRD